ncbi:MAG: cyclase family protein [Chthoniobacterales bacterium]
MHFPYHLIDLTHALDEMIPSWNGSCGFEQSIKLDYEKEEPLSFRVQQLKMHAGIGTHLDAPAHCNRGELTIDQLSLTDLIAPCVVIDVSDRADAEYALCVEEIEIFETSYGPIEPHSFVILRTGWEQFWNQPKRYHNNYLFPSISGEAAQFFLKRNVVGLGIDTLSPDKPRDGFPVHEALLGANKYIIENVANSSALPTTGSLIIALPIKTRGGTEAPMRLVALVSSN